jgi:HAD superfamily hydrolase (TIGR01509 family)
MTTPDWQPRAVIFDMDGLLVDSEPVWAIAEDAMLEERGRKPDPSLRVQIIGLRTYEFMTQLGVLYSLEESVDSLMLDLSARMLKLIPEKVVPRPGAPELVDFVFQQNLPRAIASSSPQPIIDAVVTSQKWEHVFTLRCSADDEVHGKPAPDVYLKAAARLGVHPSDCLALEDSPNGARAAVAAGMVCYAVPDPSHSGMDAFDGITPHVFDSLYSVLAILAVS